MRRNRSQLPCGVLCNCSIIVCKPAMFSAASSSTSKDSCWLWCWSVISCSLRLTFRLQSISSSFPQYENARRTSVSRAFATELEAEVAELRRPDSRGARPFLTAADFILHGLTFAELFDGHSLNFRMMEEQVALFSFDESKTAIRNQLLDFTLWHFCSPSKNLGHWGTCVRKTQRPEI